MKRNEPNIELQKVWDTVYSNMEDNVALMLLVLHDEYGFGRERIVKLLDAMEEMSQKFDEYEQDGVLDIKRKQLNMTSLTFTSGFIMNPTATNIGGWENSYMRNTICSAFLKAMPTEWQNIITACTKYTDNIGGEQSVTNNATATLDKIWLLGASEVFVNPSYINENEKTYQQRYAFYSNGNSRIKYCHKNNNQHCYWWIRSPIRTDRRYFACVAHTDGNFLSMVAANSRMGFAPGFMVA